MIAGTSQYNKKLALLIIVIIIIKKPQLTGTPKQEKKKLFYPMIFFQKSKPCKRACLYELGEPTFVGLLTHMGSMRSIHAPFFSVFVFTWRVGQPAQVRSARRTGGIRVRWDLNYPCKRNQVG